MNFQDSLHCQKHLTYWFSAYISVISLIIRCHIEIDRQVKQKQII